MTGRPNLEAMKLLRTAGALMLAGGIPAGQLSCIAAWRRPGDPIKSDIMSYVIHQAVIQGVQVLYIDVESTIDEARFQQPGLDNK